MERIIKDAEQKKTTKQVSIKGSGRTQTPREAMRFRQLVTFTNKYKEDIIRPDLKLNSI